MTWKRSTHCVHSVPNRSGRLMACGSGLITRSEKMVVISWAEGKYSSKRKDPRRVYGCTKCYQQLRPTPVCHESPYVKVREYCSFFIIHSLFSRHFSVKYCGSSISFFSCLRCFYSVGQEETHCLDQCGGLRCFRQAQI